MNHPELIVIGSSLGGREALEIILSALPEDFKVPVAIVQHRGTDKDLGIVEHLQKYTLLNVHEPEDKEIIVPGCVYIAPADYHLLIEGKQFALSTEKPLRFSRPSIDMLFSSAADFYTDKLIGVILTGANTDGADGLSRIKTAGGLTIVQSPHRARAKTMPESAISETSIDKILPVEKIGPFLVEVCK